MITHHVVTAGTCVKTHDYIGKKTCSSTLQ